MEDSDYDIDFYTADPVVLEQYQALGGQVEGKVDPREHLEVSFILTSICFNGQKSLAVYLSVS